MSQEEVELRMWRMLKDACNNEPHHTVRISRLADNHLPVPHKQWTVETVRKWGNMGLVFPRASGAQAALTEEGVRTAVPAHLDHLE